MKGPSNSVPGIEALLIQLQRPDGSWGNVGLLQRNGEINWFESFRSYWEEQYRPILGQVFEERGEAWRPSSRVALPNWFSHLLPEGRLRQAVASAAGVNERREFFLLSRIGFDDLPGAIRAVPADPSGTVIDVHERDGKDEPSSALLKFSLAGVQLKFSVVKDPARGLTIPARGSAGDWIAKLPDARPEYEGVPEAEFAGLELARRAGINVPTTALVDVGEIAGLPAWATKGGGRALLVQRFDRRSSERRVHVEELAQVLEVPRGDHLAKYRRANLETVASVTSALCGVDSVGEVIDRIVLNILIGNGDAHTKNWAYCYPDGQRAVLSPVYDVVPTVLYIPADDLGLKLGGSRRFEEMSLSRFDRLAARSGWTVQECYNRVRSAVGRVVHGWEVLADLVTRDAYKFLTRRRDALGLVRAGE